MAARTASRRLSRDLVAVGSVVAWAICAQAQEKPKESTKSDEKLQEVVITGSRIARPDLDRLEPTTVVTGELFDQRGYTDVGQALQELPAFGIQPSSAVNQQQGFGIAQSFVDLYSLGSQRTLTLINGRRFVSSSTASLFNGATSPGQQVDLNVVPTKLIERVETISVGGAPIYGADAIAGTVNIILKKNYQGLDLDAQSGVSNAKDAWSHRFRALAGRNFANGRGNITGVAEFIKTDGLTGPQRPDVANDLQFLKPAGTSPFKTVLTTEGAVGSISTSGVPYVDDFFYLPRLPPSLIGVTNAAGQPLAWAPGSSSLSVYNLGTATGSNVFWFRGDGIRLSQFTNLLSPTKRANLDMLGNFKFTDHFAFFMEGWFSEGHATNLITQPGYSTPFFGSAGQVNGAWRVSIDNPFLSAADRATIQNALNAYGASLPFADPTTGFTTFDPNWDGTHFYVDRANTDLQSGRAVADQVVSRGVMGINGDFAVGERSYNWEIAANYGYSRDVNRTPSYVFQNVQNALNATRDASGNIVCAGNPVNSVVTTGSATCAPLNIFGLGSPSAAARAYITHNAIATSINTQRDVSANLTGGIVKLPAGEWKGAVGYENRRESADFEPDDYYTLNAGTSVASPVSGSYRTNEFYAETLIPIFAPIQSLPALHQLELEGAVRRVDNTFAGNSTTWTSGLRWAPIEDLQFRGNKTHSIRAPAATELFLAPSTAFEFANDPCDVTFINQGQAAATRAKNCAAAGIPAGFLSNVVNATAAGITSGNQQLTSETADSKALGVVLRPRFISRFSLAVDYIEINLANAIQVLNLTNILDACYDSPNYPNEPSCALFTRNGAHQITSFTDGFRNAALLDFQGVTFGMDWNTTLPRGLGALALRANWLNTRKLVQQVGSEAPSKLLGELATNTAAPHDKGTFDINYRKGPFQWYWQALYVGPFNFSNTDKSNSKDVLGVSHWWLVNTTLGYELSRAFEMRLIVNNVGNKEPPVPGLAGIGGNFESPTSLYWSGIIGRTYLLSAAYRF